MKKILLIILSTLLLISCATRVLKSDKNGVVTDSFTPNYTDSQKAADAECAKYNRTAKMVSGVNAYDRKVTFECVEEEQKSKDNKNTNDMFTELKKLKDLLNSKIITQEEFEIQKKKILNKYQ